MSSKREDVSDVSDEARTSSGDTACPVVAIGASAGGLQALKQFFDAMPADSGLAFVLIQHLSPHHESLTDKLLAPHTQMPVRQIAEGMAVEPNCVFVIPPGKYLDLRDKIFHLKEALPHKGIRMPIDAFFRALAAECREKAAGILLSGTGADGTMGLKEIKALDGLVLAQDPQTAQYDGMVRSAIEAGLVDHVLTIADMPEVLHQYFHHAPHLRKGGEAPADTEGELDTILKMLRRRTGYNFQSYKEGTLLRRIGRRMGLHYCDTMPAYVEILSESPEELDHLFQDLLISVTSFFREPEAFECLTRELIEKRLKAKPDGEPLRVWVSGCATGEEAYSLAILFRDQFDKLGRDFPLQIFATDIDNSALDIARAGAYPVSIADNIPEEQIERYFTREESVFRVRDFIRESVTFARQNLLADPPFSRLDLISCRNLMIYLKPEMQRKVTGLFHFALADGGYLFLGSTESIGAKSDLFEIVDKKARIFKKLSSSRRRLVGFPLQAVSSAEEGSRAKGDSKRSGSKSDAVANITQKLLLEKYAPAAVLINQGHQILYYYGTTDRYLKQPSGAPTDDLTARARDGLHIKLRALLHKAEKEGGAVSGGGTKVALPDGTTGVVRIAVEPAKMPHSNEPLWLVVFEDEREAPLSSPESEASRANSEDEIRQLERQLRDTEEDLQGMIEELESANEELKSANEEIMSMNEELQSSNEELESSKEELQSMNEELNTVNSQLQHKVEELETLNNDLNNLLANTHVATLFLDRESRLKRFTPAIRELFNLIDSDLGRPICDLSHYFGDGQLQQSINTVLETLDTAHEEIRTADERWYTRLIRPYRTSEGRVEGVVITFFEITDLKEKEAALQRLAAAMRDSNDAMLLLDLRGNILEWNRGAELMYGWRRSEMVGRSLYDLVPDDVAEATSALLKQVERGEEVESFDTRRLTRDGRELDIWLTLTALGDEDGKPTAVTTTERDITEHKRIQENLLAAKAEAEEANAYKSRFLAAASHDLRQPMQSLKLIHTLLLLQAGGDHRYRELLDQQSEVLTVMTTLLNALLDLGELESGAVQTRKAPFGAVELFSALQSEFGHPCDEKGIELRVKPCNYWVHSDRGLVERILHNFLANAVKFTNGGRILVGCRRRGRFVRIEVWDTGKGIAGEQLEAIFREFYQVDNATRDRSEGLGLGLSIVKQLADILGHRLEVRSLPGKGSVFAIELPRADAPHARPPGSAPAEALLEVVDASRHLLLIEDDRLVALSLVRLLRAGGYEVVHALHSDAAFERLRDKGFRPDMVISDFRLPGERSGLETIAQVRELLDENIPAILLTGDTLSVRPEDVQLPELQILYKPIQGKALLGQISAMLQDRLDPQ